MNFHLGCRSRIAVFFENVLCGFQKIEVNGPVICGVDPGTADDLVAAVIGTGNTDHDCRILENQFVVFSDALDQGSCLGKFRTVRNGIGQIHSTKLLFGEVCNGCSGSSTVWYIDDFVVNGDELGTADIDFLNGTGVTGNFDIVINTEGAGDQKQNAACQIGQRAVYSQAGTNTQGSNKSGDAACIDAQVIDKTQDDKNL